MRDTQILGPHPTGIRNFPPLFAVKSDLISRVDNPKLAFICFLMGLPNTVWLITSNAGRVDVRCFHFRLIYLAGSGVHRMYVRGGALGIQGVQKKCSVLQMLITFF